MNRPGRLLALSFVAIVWLAVVACGTGPAAEKPSTTAKGAHPGEKTSHGGSTSSERTVSRGDRTTKTGLITQVQRTSTGKWILVEENPDIVCLKLNRPGCDKMYYEVLEKPARILRDEGCDGEAVEEASAEDLEVGQRVRAWTGEPYATSNPGQARAWEVIICAGAPENATAASYRDGTEERVFFPKQPPETNTYMMAEFRGELLLDERGCLRVRDKYGSVVPVWPPGFEAEPRGGQVFVRDGRGRVVGRVGESIYMAGGEVPLRGWNDEEMMRELRERCPGSYWLAAPEVRIPSQQ